MENLKGILNKVYDVYESKISVPLAILLTLVFIVASSMMVKIFIVDNIFSFYANNVYTYCKGIVTLDEVKMKENRDILLSDKNSIPEIKRIVEIGDTLTLTKEGVEPVTEELKELISSIATTLGRELHKGLISVKIALCSAFLFILSVIPTSLKSKKHKIKVFNISMFTVYTLSFLIICLMNYTEPLDFIPIGIAMLMLAVSIIALYFSVLGVDKLKSKKQV